MIKTKIICTIGPSVNSLEKILELIDAGMNVARLNFSHGTHEEHHAIIQKLKEARLKTGRPLGIMLDTKGPEIRVGPIVDGSVFLECGQQLRIEKDLKEGNNERITVNPSYILDDLHVGSAVLFDDGYISSQVIELGKDFVTVQIENGGVLKAGKGVNVPNGNLSIPFLTDQDIADIRFGCENNVDIIAVSFVRTASDILTVRQLLADTGKTDTIIVAKIETSESVQNIDSIVQVADGIMIARGDLGVEVPLSSVPKLQKMMIRKCYLAGKTSITATQMLESMIQNPRPTRAEVSDVANAIYDSTSCVMLSGETAAGKYPIEAVKVMRSVVHEAEKEFDYRGFFAGHSDRRYQDVPSSVTLATVKTAYSSRARAIFAITSRGGTARLLSRLRPSIPILALTANEKSYHQLSLYWGVIAMYCDSCQDIEDSQRKMEAFALKRGLLFFGDLVIVTAGTPFGVCGTTNMMMVQNIGDVLVRAYRGYGQKAHGKISIVMSPGEKKDYEVQGCLLVITKCDDSYLPLLKQASGVILQNSVEDMESERYVLFIAKALDLSVIVRADDACSILHEGQMVTLDPEKHLVFNGILS